jgi:hypothetical protein
MLGVSGFITGNDKMLITTVPIDISWLNSVRFVKISLAYLLGIQNPQTMELHYGTLNDYNSNAAGTVICSTDSPNRPSIAILNSSQLNGMCLWLTHNGGTDNSLFQLQID